MGAIKVLLYTDQPILMIGLYEILSERGFECHTASTQIILRARVFTDQIDVALVGLTDELRFDTLRAISEKTKVLLLSGSTINPEYAFQVMSCGVRGVVRNTLPPDIVAKFITRAHEGKLCFEKELVAKMGAGRRIRLTPRERQLTMLIAQGYRNKEIATSLFISEGTVKVYLSRLFTKIGVESRHELAMWTLHTLATEEVHGETVAPARNAAMLDNLLLGVSPAAEDVHAI